MRKPGVVLIQKPNSPLTDLIHAALAADADTHLWRAAGPDLPKAAPPGCLHLWDLCGWEADEVRRLLAQDGFSQAPLVLASLGVGVVERLALGEARPLGLVVSPPTSLAVAAALEVAWATHGRMLALTEERRRLESAWEDREVIERAKMALMAAKGYSEAEAMRRMQRHSRDTNQKLAVVARQLIAAHQVFDEGDD